MATEFLQSGLEDRTYVPTSSVSSIRATTDKTRVNVQLECENGSGNAIETFYSTTLYAFNGAVELSDVGSLVEEYFRRRGKVADTIDILFDTAILSVHFLYCENMLMVDFDPTKSFFLAAGVQRVYPDSIVAIAAVDHGSNTYFYLSAVGHRKADGTPAVVRMAEQKNLGAELTAYFSVADIIKWALNQTDAETEEELADVLYFSIEYAGIQKMFYIVPAPAYLTFAFRNAFNVLEYVDVAGEMTVKTDVSGSTAVCGGRARRYDRIVERIYVVQTEPLTPEEVHIFEQFIASHSVELCLDDANHDVIITDSTCEPSTDDETLTSVKFTWRFTDERPCRFTSLMDGVMPSRRNIFDSTFSAEYE